MPGIIVFIIGSEYGDPDWIRTSDHMLRRHVLYPTELRGHNMVRLVGLEPTWLTPTDFKSVVYTDSTTVA